MEKKFDVLKKEKGDFDKLKRKKEKFDILKTESPETKIELLYKMGVHRSYHTKVKEMIETSKKSIYLCGWIDDTFTPDLNKKFQDDVEIKIITHKIDKSGDIRDKQSKINACNWAWNTLGKNNFTYGKIHGRFLIKDDSEAIIGSADFDRELGTGRIDFGIWTNDKIVIAELIKLFSSLFEASRKVKHPP